MCKAAFEIYVYRYDVKNSVYLYIYINTYAYVCIYEC